MKPRFIPKFGGSFFWYNKKVIKKIQSFLQYFGFFKEEAGGTELAYQPAASPLLSFVGTGKKIAGRKIAENLGYSRSQSRKPKIVRNALAELNQNGIRAIQTRNPKLYILT